MASKAKPPTPKQLQVLKDMLGNAELSVVWRPLMRVRLFDRGMVEAVPWSRVAALLTHGWIAANKYKKMVAWTTIYRLTRKGRELARESQ